jgi:hypothetical protein
MKTKLRQLLCVIPALMLAFLAGMIFSRPSANPISSAVVTAKEAKEQNAEWGTFYTYYQGETYGNGTIKAWLCRFDLLKTTSEWRNV